MRKEYQIYKTLNTMLKDRKYDVKNQNKITLKEFEERFIKNDKVEIPNEYFKGDGQTVKVIFALDEKFGSQSLKSLINDFEYDKTKHAILIASDFTPDAIKGINNIKDDLRIENFKNKELYTPVIRKKYQPKSFKIMNDEDIEDLNIQYGNIDKFPRIKTSDAVSKYFNLQIGEVIRFDRGNRDYYYRRVIK
jgi:DNA-directed RNA polymerase subunit H (RpoH/RPB5)